MTKRKQGFYAVVEIPKPLRPLFDMKPRFLKSLETRELKIAERRLPIVVNGWKMQLEKVRGSSNSAEGLLWEIAEWRKTIERLNEGDMSSGDYEDIHQWLDAITKSRGVAAAEDARNIVFNNAQALQSHIEPWFASIKHLDAKTQSLQKLAVTDLCGYFKTNVKIDKTSVKEYLEYLRTEKGLSDKTIAVRLSSMRSFIRYMDDAFHTNLLPLFTIKALPRNATAKTVKQRAWIPFSSEEVSKLYQAALTKKKPDPALADLIAFGAYTGCRIEELAQLRTEHFNDKYFKVEDSKTAAGIREVPVHPALSGVIKRLRKNSKNGFLLEGSDKGSFGKRGDALGKRFGILKTALGYGSQHVFHSIRKTVVSQLEQAGVSENTTADIVGHDKPRITYGLYSSGASMKQKTEALAKVAYGGDLANPL